MDSHPPRTPRLRAAVALVLLVLPVLLLGTAAPAAAHASLIGSDPAQGAVLEAAPGAVTFTFTESVSAVPDSTRVMDAGGVVVPSSVSASGPELTVSLDGPVGDGTLVILWRVVSADGHPVSGTLTFSVGAASDAALPPPVEPDAAGAPALLGLARALGYITLFLAAGLIAFAVLLLPLGSGADPPRTRVLALARRCAVLAALVWIAQVPLTAGYQFGGGPTDVGSWDSLSPAEYVVPAAVAFGLSASAVLAARARPGRQHQALALAPLLLAVAAPAFVGHTRAESPLALVIGADVLHLLAGSTWLGGLLALAITLRSLADEDGRAAEVLSRFSTLAAGILAALLLTGSFLAWRVLGSWSALVGIAYGRLLLVKIAAVVLVIGLAAWNRFRLLPRLRGSGGAGEGAALLRRTTLAEAGVLVAVLFVTGFLVDRSPEAEVAAVERERESVQTADLGDITVRVTMTPLLPGTNVVALEMSDAAGEPVEGLEAPVVRISSGDLDFGELELTNQGPGVYEGRGLLPEPGTWDVQVSLKVDEFTVPVDTVEFVIDAG